MSDDWITLIPEDPSFIPDDQRQERARARFAEIAPDAEAIELKVSDTIQFFDCGENLERIVCPSCASEIPVEWWQDQMDADYRGEGFNLAPYRVPCCNAAHTLHELVYIWSQGFGRFALDAMNPNIGRLDDAYREELEDLLGTRLRVIYQHV
jgi:hypothetical protein